MRCHLVEVVSGQRGKCRRAWDTPKLRRSVQSTHLPPHGGHEPEYRFTPCPQPVEDILVDVEQGHGRQHAARRVIAHQVRRQIVKALPQMRDTALYAGDIQAHVFEHRPFVRADLEKKQKTAKKNLKPPIFDQKPPH